MLGTSLARPVIAKAQIQVAKEEGCDFVSHGNSAALFFSVPGVDALKSFIGTFSLTLRPFAGCTGKGNDQVRVSIRN